MGLLLIVRCGCHKREKELDLGFGGLYEEQYTDIVSRMKAGRFGEEEKNIITYVKYAVVDTTSYIFWCRHCGHYTARESLDLYVPKNLGQAKIFLSGADKSLDEWSKLPGWWPEEYGYDYHCIRIKQHKHICPFCKHEMKQISEEEFLKKKCPKCHKTYECVGHGNWD